MHTEIVLFKAIQKPSQKYHFYKTYLKSNFLESAESTISQCTQKNIDIIRLDCHHWNILDMLTKNDEIIRSKL
jgi:hypothetical protein